MAGEGLWASRSCLFILPFDFLSYKLMYLADKLNTKSIKIQIYDKNSVQKRNFDRNRSILVNLNCLNILRTSNRRPDSWRLLHWKSLCKPTQSSNSVALNSNQRLKYKVLTCKIVNLTILEHTAKLCITSTYIHWHSLSNSNTYEKSDLRWDETSLSPRPTLSAIQRPPRPRG